MGEKTEKKKRKKRKLRGDERELKKKGWKITSLNLKIYRKYLSSTFLLEKKRKRKSPSWVIKNKKDSDKTSRRDVSHHVTSRRRPTPSPLPLDLSRVSVVGKAEGWKGERGGWEIKIKTNNNRRRFTHCFCFIVKYDDDNNYYCVCLFF